MPFIPHTPDDVPACSRSSARSRIDDLFDEIPPALQAGALGGVPPALRRWKSGGCITERAARDGRPLNFIGAGAYEHHIPAPVWAIATRGEFYSAYTPYQAEASQGTLAVDLRISVHDLRADRHGGVERLAVRRRLGAGRGLSHGGARQPRARIRGASCVPRTVNPTYLQGGARDRRQSEHQLRARGFRPPRGTHTAAAAASASSGQDVTALVMQQPNFFGMLEEVDELTDWAHANKCSGDRGRQPDLARAAQAPGRVGQPRDGRHGADIVCGEGQPLGVPLASGGPYFGFMATRMQYVRQMPGRIVGRTVDTEGRPGFTLTLQAREQHIRRSKATSNICTNQGLLVTAATIYMSLLGAQAWSASPPASAQRTADLVGRADGNSGRRARRFRRALPRGRLAAGSAGRAGARGARASAGSSAVSISSERYPGSRARAAGLRDRNQDSTRTSTPMRASSGANRSCARAARGAAQRSSHGRLLACARTADIRSEQARPRRAIAIPAGGPAAAGGSGALAPRAPRRRCPRFRSCRRCGISRACRR